MSSIHVHSERSARTGICIVWPAYFLGSTDPELHSTALFLGHTDTAEFERSAVENLLQWQGVDPGAARVTGLELFGREKDVPVLTVESEVMRSEHEWMLRELDLLGVKPSTEFSFNPHVTIAKEAEHVREELFRPRVIYLERPTLWWGDERVLHSVHTAKKVESGV